MIFVHALGTAQIDAGTARVTPTSVRRFALLLYLAAEAGRRVSRTTLHELICPDQSEKNAHHTLREILYQLRKAGTSVISDRHGIELPPDVVQADYSELITRTHPDEEQLHAATAGFLPGYGPTHSEAFSEWFDAYRTRVAFDLSASLIAEASRAKAIGDWSRTELAARACLAIDSLNEEATLLLAEMLAIGGAKIQAVRLLDSYIRDVGAESDLRIPAAVLRRRISEASGPRYNTISDALPFLGRENEMSMLQDAVNQACSGSKRCVLVSGEPGIGKTRLLEEFRKSAELTGATVLALAAREREGRKALAVAAELARQLLPLPGALACDPQAMDALSRLSAIDDRNGDRPGRRQLAMGELTWGFCDLLDAVTAESPLILLFDDAQWLDRASAHVLYALARTSPKSQFLLVVATRDRAMWQGVPGGDVWDRHVTISPLNESASEFLIRAALNGGEESSATETAKWICSVSGGNPLFVSTLARHYQQTGERFRVPVALSELLVRRLKSLTPEPLRLLRLSGVFGKYATVQRLCRAMRIDGSRILELIEDLEMHSLIRVGTSTISPAHQLVAEAALAGCSTLWLAAAHRLVANALSVDAPTDRLLRWDCADHLALAGENRQAAEMFEQLSEEAMVAGQPFSAAETLARALELSDSAKERIRVARKLVLLGHALADSSFGLIGAQALQTLGADTDHDDVELATLQILGFSSLDEREIDARFMECITSATATPEHRAQAAVNALKYADIRGRDDVAEKVLAALPPETLEGVSEFARLEFEMIAAAVTCRFDDSVRIARQFLDAMRRRRPPSHCRNLMNVALVFSRAGLEGRALDVLDECLAEARRIRAVEIQVRSHMFRVGLLVDEYRDVEALAELEEIDGMVRRDLNSLSFAEYTTTRIDLALTRGDVRTAQQLLEDQGHGISFFGHATGRRWRAAIEARIHQITQATPVSPASIRLIATQRQCGSSAGLSDFEAAVVCHEFLRRGMPTEALEHTRRYLATRRWRSRYSRALNEALSAAASAASCVLQ